MSGHHFLQSNLDTIRQYMIKRLSTVTLILNVNSQLSLSRIPRDFLKYFEIFVLRHIRFAELRNFKINRITTFYKCISNFTPEVGKIIIENIVEKRRNCSLGAISPLFHNILLPVVRHSCLNRDQIFTLR